MPHLVNLLDKKDLKNKVLSEQGYSLVEFYKVSDYKQKQILKEIDQKLYDEIMKRATEEGKRIFDAYSTEGIGNPTYLFIGVITGKGFTQINFVDAKEFEDMFIEKWEILTK